ncbi:MAG TPA: polyhydroxyalkanoate synthesis regulator DNA-binding domain-containing protein [Kofleriaceae bacterium]|nr:polyhydroxyalkanoate synthesis regulator DNA-binding domain-containing protein [Kofleriaceae bacterium]
MATVVIKKYGNRRLYDTGDSRYVTLDELAAKIRTGVDLRIVDAQTGEDLTQATLTQIVLETGHAAKFLPVQLLTQMIRLSDDSLAEFFSRYVTSALDMYLQAKRGVQALTTYNPLAQIPMAATDALARMWMGSPFGGPPQYAGPPQYGYPGPAPYPVPSPPAAPDDETEESSPPKRRSEPDMRPRAKSEPGVQANGDSRDDVAAMRRELEELKQALRESLPKKKKKPTR